MASLAEAAHITTDRNGLPAHLAGKAAFVAAARHSRRVRFLRRAIPVASLAAVAFLVTRSFVGFVGGLDPTLSGVAIEGRKVVMEKPKLSGFKRDGRSYELTSTTARQDLKEPNVVELDSLKARMQTGNEGWADLNGTRGIYDSKAEKLNVEGGVNLRTETGVDAKLQDARIQFRQGLIETDKPVEVNSPQGQINADRMQVIDNGKRLVFEGRVRSVFVNGQGPASPPAPEAAERKDGNHERP